MKVFKSVLFAGFAVLVAANAPAQPLPRAALARLAAEFAPRSYAELRECLSLPNDAHFPEHVQQNLAWMQQAFGKRGFSTKVLETGGPPLLLAERHARNPQRTVLIYLQIDGQPVDSSKWYQESPYKPALKKKTASGVWQEIPWVSLQNHPDPDWRIFARSVSDAKGPVMMFLTALDAIAAKKLAPSYTLKVIMDFEEEQGSPHLPAAVTKYRDDLRADMLIIFDGPRHITNQPSLTFGARGIATVQLTVFGPRVPQHSGHYGNYAPNPAQRLARLLASMKGDDGRVTIPGWYDGIVLDEKTRDILAQVPDDEAFIKRKLGIAEADKVGRTYQESLQYPSLNVRGMAAGWVRDKVRTIIPAEALAEIDIRLVPESDPARLISLLRRHIEQQGYHLVAGQPTEAERATYPKLAAFSSEISYQAFRTPYDAEVGRWLTRAFVRAFGKPPIRKRISGGSIPISPFVTTLGIPAVTVPTVNSDNNQHSPNENLRLGNYWEGIRTFIAILTESF